MYLGCGLQAKENGRTQGYLQERARKEKDVNTEGKQRVNWENNNNNSGWSDLHFNKKWICVYVFVSVCLCPLAVAALKHTYYADITDIQLPHT